jgi:hypothetical protein
MQLAHACYSLVPETREVEVRPVLLSKTFMVAGQAEANGNPVVPGTAAGGDVKITLVGTSTLSANFSFELLAFQLRLPFAFSAPPANNILRTPER